MYLPSLHPSCCQGQFCCRCAVRALPPYSLAQTAVYSEKINTKITRSLISTLAFIVGLKVFKKCNHAGCQILVDVELFL